MAIERLVGLYVTNEGLYQKYRDAMFPILQSHGGAFGYDFKVSEVLKSQVDAPINRVFTIFFDNEAAMDAFFADDRYLAIRKKYFEPSVKATTEIAKYRR